MVGSIHICLNGHVLREENMGRSDSLDTCIVCGAKTISKCPSCGKDIAENNAVLCKNGPGGRGSPPKVCRFCGSRFPWSVNILSDDKMFDFSCLKKNLDFSDVTVEEDMSD